MLLHVVGAAKRVAWGTNLSSTGTSTSEKERQRDATAYSMIVRIRDSRRVCLMPSLFSVDCCWTFSLVLFFLCSSFNETWDEPGSPPERGYSVMTSACVCLFLVHLMAMDGAGLSVDVCVCVGVNADGHSISIRVQYFGRVMDSEYGDENGARQCVAVPVGWTVSLPPAVLLCFLLRLLAM